MAIKFKSNLKISAAPANPNLRTENLFDDAYTESKDSPISEFMKRLQQINKLAPQPTNFDHLQGQLVLLGVVAAVESYFRTLLRHLISEDSLCQELAHDRNVSFGAAIHLSKEMLPEAILEGTTFISRKAILEDVLRDLIGIKGNVPADLDVAVNDYVRVCHLRHCAVHRFGKLGARNAISLGMSNHSKILEKPLKLTYGALQDAIAIATGLVRTINNFLFNESISRLPNSIWSEKYKEDKALFHKYYDIFADTVSTFKSPEPKNLYMEFMKQRKEVHA